MKALLTLLSEAGVTVVDQMLNNRTVVAPKERSHAMWLQAGQVVAYGALLKNTSTFSLNALLSTYATTTADAAIPVPAWRGYFTAALKGASTPSELAWRADLLANPQSGPGLLTALTRGTDAPLSIIQVILLSVRATGEAWNALVWLKNHPTGPVPTSHPASFRTARIADRGRTVAPPNATGTLDAFTLTNPKGPCGGVPIPDWVYTATADATGYFWDWAVKSLETAAKTAKTAGKLAGEILGWVGLAATVLNFLAMRAFFHANFAATTNLTRTKKTTEDQNREPLSVQFAEDPPAGLWLNCLRLVAALKSLDASVPEPGPWAGASVKWTVLSGPGVFTQPERSTQSDGETDSDGIVRTIFAAARQDTDKTALTQTVPNSATVRAAVDPATMTTTANRILQWAANAAEFGIGVASGGITGGEFDVAAKAIIAFINSHTNFWSTTTTVPITDWGNPILKYTVVVAQNQPSTTEVSTGLCHSKVTIDTSETGKYSLEADIPLTAGTSSGASTGNAPLRWVSASDHQSYSATTTGGDPKCGGVGQPDPCKSAPSSGAVISTADLVGTTPGIVFGQVANLGHAGQTMSINPQGVSENMKQGGNDCQSGTLPDAHFLELLHHVAAGQFTPNRVDLGPLGVKYFGGFTSGPTPAISSLIWTGKSKDGYTTITEHLSVEPPP